MNNIPNGKFDCEYLNDYIKTGIDLRTPLFITFLVLPIIAFLVVFFFPEEVDLAFNKVIVYLAKFFRVMDKEIVLF